MDLDKEIFSLFNPLVQKKFKRFKKYYVQDSKRFINKVDRDYSKTGFPVHVINTFEKIKENNYDYLVCILRGGLPYSTIFEVMGAPDAKYVICGRINENITLDKYKLRYDESADSTLSRIKDKNILLVENNSFSGNTSLRVLEELEKYRFSSADLFLDYIIPGSILDLNRLLLKPFGKVYIAREAEPANKGHEKIKRRFLSKLKAYKS